MDNGMGEVRVGAKWKQGGGEGTYPRLSPLSLTLSPFSS